MKYNITLLFFLLTFGIMAQETSISGEIKDAKNNSILDYVNIGISNKNTGTISDAKGNFNLKLTTKSLQVIRLYFRILVLRLKNY